MNITLVVEAVGLLLFAVFTCIIAPYIRSRTTVEQQESINMWVGIAVTAAEQIFAGSGRGAEKKRYVIEFLNKKGFKLDEASVDAMIESAVNALHKGLI